MYSNKLYGYLIDSAVLYFPAQSQLISKTGRFCLLRDTMGKLLYYLILHADKEVITDDDLLRNIWEKNGLSGTHSRLWQVMKNLNRNINELGIENDLFMRVRGKGYYVSGGKVTPLYTRVEREKRTTSQANDENQPRGRDFLLVK